MKKLILIPALLWFSIATASEPIRVMFIGAHPDEAEAYVGGTLALFAEMGHKVKIVSLTNGDIGHYNIGGGQLAKRRMAEAAKVGEFLPAEYEILDIHDGELEPDIKTRKEVIRSIREFRPDIIITFQAFGWGHPDNRAAGKLVHDASSFAYGVPNIVPLVEPLTKSPLYLIVGDYASVEITKADIAVCIDDVIDKRIYVCDAHASQFYEFDLFLQGTLDDPPVTPEEKKEMILEYHKNRINVNQKRRLALVKWYGEERTGKMKYAESFEIAPYSSNYPDEQIRALFPMFQLNGND